MGVEGKEKKQCGNKKSVKVCAEESTENDSFHQSLNRVGKGNLYV